jgi:signal transduction histidine kinase/ActR/RegA family two-component response regulator
MFRQRISIAVLLTVALVAAATVLIGAFGAFTYRSERQQQFDSLLEDHKRLADQLAVGLALPLWNFDRDQINRIIDGAMGSDDVAAVVVHLADRNGSIEARTRDAQWRPRPATQGVSTAGLFVERRRIMAGDAEVGTLDLLVTPRFLEEQLSRMRITMILAVTGFDGVLVLVLGSLLWWFVLKPLKQVELYAAAVRSGSPAPGFAGGTFRGELESLRASIAAMVDLLDARYTELRESKEGLRARYARHQFALTVLTRSDVRDPDDLVSVLQQITEVVAQSLGVACVSVWRFTAHGTALVCEDLFEPSPGRHSSGTRFSAEMYPALFDDTAESEISVHDAASDPRFEEFSRLVMAPAGVTTILQAQIRSRGVRSGSLACAHVGPPRVWTPDEQTFLSAVANLISAQIAQIDRQRAEAQLRQAHKMEAIGQLAGGVAHDFNNILTVILGKAAMVADDAQLPAAARTAASDIAEAGERAAALTRQLLLFSRRQAVTMRGLDLNDAVAHVSRMLRRIVGENVSIDVRASKDPLHVKGDVVMIEQVLLNLAVNARDAMPSGGPLVIQTEPVDLDSADAARRGHGRAGAFACLRVTDAGTGIPPEHMPHIFEPFFTTKDVGKGTGLGLATTYGIVQQHDGWIEVESEIGRGTTFVIFLPRTSTAVEPARPVHVPVRAARGSETILVVEDEQDVRMLVCEALAGYGYRILEAADGPEAIEVWQASGGAIDLVVTDMTMPEGMTGIELVRILRQKSPELKVIYMSGYFADVSSADLDVDDSSYLAKPFTLAELGRAVRHSMDNGKAPFERFEPADR